MMYKLKYKSFGEHCILVEWPSTIEKNILSDILVFKKSIQESNSTQIIEVRHAYNSLLVIYDFFVTNYEDSVTLLISLYNSKGKTLKTESRLWKIPVCYDEVFGLDLEQLSKEKNRSIEALIKRHSQVVYSVCFIGFLPGFLYLGGLDETLKTPRKASPRLKINKGSVAIGGNQTGIYPIESPGGWNIIGNTPIEFFNPKNNPPCFAEAGDNVQFYPVSLSKHQEIKTLVDAKVFQIENEVSDG